MVGDQNGALITMLDAAEDFDSSRLSGTVTSNQGTY